MHARAQFQPRGEGSLERNGQLNLQIVFALAHEKLRRLLAAINVAKKSLASKDRAIHIHIAKNPKLIKEGGNFTVRGGGRRERGVFEDGHLICREAALIECRLTDSARAKYIAAMERLVLSVFYPPSLTRLILNEAKREPFSRKSNNARDIRQRGSE